MADSISKPLIFLMLGTKFEYEFIYIFKMKKLTEINTYLTSFFKCVQVFSIYKKKKNWNCSRPLKIRWSIGIFIISSLYINFLITYVLISIVITVPKLIFWESLITFLLTNLMLVMFLYDLITADVVKHLLW